MIGLSYRDELDEPVARELDNIIAKLKGFLSAEHNEDGTHKFDSALDAATVNSIISTAQDSGQWWLKGPWLLDDPSSARPHRVGLRPPAPSTVTFRMEVIEYTGNGVNDRAITTSFALDTDEVAVFVYNVPSNVFAAAEAPACRTNAYADTYIDGSSTEVSTGIKTFTSTGFTVGTHNSVNKNGDLYIAVVMWGKSPTFSVGAYNGTGVATAVDTGITPAVVWVVGRQFTFRTTDFTGDQSLSHGGNASITGMITGFSGTEFSVGTHNNVNDVSLNYGFVAISSEVEAESIFEAFTGTGTAAAGDAISGFGFQPAFVIGQRYNAGDIAGFRSTNSHTSTNSQPWQAAVTTTYIRSIDADGATLGETIAPNGATYHGYAWKSSGTVTSTSMNNYAPVGVDEAVVIEITPIADTTITGLKAIEGLQKKRMLLLRNASTTYSITIAHDSSSSLATYRFKLPRDRDVELSPNQNVWLYYDPALQRWTCSITPHGAGGLGSGLSAGSVETITEKWHFSADLELTGVLDWNDRAQGDVLYASADDTVTGLAKDTNATRYLSNTGTSNNPAWAQVNLANGVTGDLPFANLTQGSALSVLGVTGNATADHASIAAGTDNQVLRRSGTAVAFGAVNLASSDAVTGTLAVGNGGTGVTAPSGVYTPTLTNVANLDASTNYECQYLRVGNTVIVSGKVDVDPTLTATSTQLGISLPIASNLGAVEDCAGTAFASAIAGQGAAILGDAANNRAQMEWVSTDVTNQPMYFTFTYQVI